jgi:hypothetical protein
MMLRRRLLFGIAALALFAAGVGLGMFVQYRLQVGVAGEVQALRAEVLDRDWEIAELKAKLGDPGAVAGEKRDLLIGKWKTPLGGWILEFTRDGKFIEIKTGTIPPIGGLGGGGENASITIIQKYVWLDDGHIGLEKLNLDGDKPIRERHKVVVTKDDLAFPDSFRDPDSVQGWSYKRVK